MSLADHYDGGWLESGWHTVTVKSFRTFEYNTGSPGVEFELRGDEGQRGSVSFNLLEQCLYKLGQFAKACGLSREQAKRYDTSNPNSHKLLVGNRVKVFSEKPKGSDYHEVTEWDAVDQTGAPPATPPPAEPAPLPTAAEANAAEAEAPPTGKDIPF